MKKLILLSVTVLSACVVPPPHPRVHHLPHPPGVIVPHGVVYVAPAYSAPGPGYAWRHDHRRGWGWHHERHGWHREHGHGHRHR